MSAHGVEIVLEVIRVIVGNEHRFEGSEVCQHHPLPRSHENVLWLDVTVHDACTMRIFQTPHELINDPELLPLRQERARRQSVMQVRAEELSYKICRDKIAFRSPGKRLIPYLIRQQVCQSGKTIKIVKKWSFSTCNTWEFILGKAKADPT